MAETWYWRNSTGAAAGPGTRRALSQTQGSANTANSVTAGAWTWNYEQTDARSIQAGNWSWSYKVLTAGGGGSAARVTTTIAVYDSAGSLKSTLNTAQTGNLTSGALNTVSGTVSEPQVDLASGDIVIISVSQTQGSRNVDVYYNGTADYEATLVHPDAIVPTATAASTLPKLTTAATAQNLRAEAASTLPKLTTSAAAEWTPTGYAANTLPKLTQAAVAATSTAAAASTLPKFTQAAAVELIPFTYASLAELYEGYRDLEAGQVREVVDEELVPLGVFLITSVEVNTGPNGTTVSVQGADRALRISRNRWAEPYSLSGVSTEQAIQLILADRWEDVTASLAETGRTVTRATFGGATDNDPWADARRLAEAAGYDLFFDGEGVAVLSAVRDYDGAEPDESYEQDEEAMVLEVRRGLTNERAYNGVIATGEGTEVATVVRAEAWDDDPDSPTYRFGPYGQYPRFYSSPLLATEEQAQSAAEAILSRAKGIVESVEWVQIVDPSLDAGDFIAIYNEDAKLARGMVIDRLTIPLSPADSMKASARAVRVTGGFAEGDE